MGGWGLGNPNLVRILKTVRNIGRSLTRRCVPGLGWKEPLQIDAESPGVLSSRMGSTFINAGSQGDLNRPRDKGYLQTLMKSHQDMCL